MKKVKAIAILVLGLTLLFALPATAGPVLDRILKKGELVVGTSGDQPPLTAKNRKGEIIGLEADLAESFAAAMGVRLKFQVRSFSELLPALLAGKVDLILSGMTITPKRNLKVAFVGPYFISGKGILTKLETVASAQDPGDINRPDFTLAALQDSTSQLFTEQMIPDAKLVTTKTLDEALDLLFKGEVDALIADYPFCAVAALRYRGKRLVAGEARFTFEPIGIALPSNDPLLVNWIENFLSRLSASGALKQLEDRWFKNGSWLKELP